MIDRFIRTMGSVSFAFGVLAAVMIFVSVGIVCHMVFVRFVLGQSTVWQTPVVTYGLIAATFLGSPYVLATRGHVNVDILPLFLPQRGRVILAITASAVSLAFCIVVVLYGVEFWHEAWANDWTSPSVFRIPLWIPYASLPVGFALLSLQCLADLIAISTGRAMPFGLSPEDRP
jgi:TRAP-type C4-dicarboxylate transport system permease small subunit